MDAIKTQLMRLKTDVPDCTATRQRFRSILSDYFPTEKQMINAILNAYDEDAERKLNTGTDRTLAALQLIKTLKNDYGMTEDSAFTAVVSWCYILGIVDVADALESVKPANTTTPAMANQGTLNQMTLACGKYICGVDFPAGFIRLKVVSLMPDKQAQHQGVYYSILRKGGSAIVENGFIKNFTTLPLKEGQRLEIGWQGEVELTVLPGEV